MATDELIQQLVKYLEDVHSTEQNAIAQAHKLGGLLDQVADRDLERQGVAA